MVGHQAGVDCRNLRTATDNHPIERDEFKEVGKAAGSGARETKMPMTRLFARRFMILVAAVVVMSEGAGPVVAGASAATLICVMPTGESSTRCR